MDHNPTRKSPHFNRECSLGLLAGNFVIPSSLLTNIDPNTTAFDVKKTGGKYHATGKNVISKDGKTLTQTSKGTSAEGKPEASTNVFDKQ